MKRKLKKYYPLFLSGVASFYALCHTSPTLAATYASNYTVLGGNCSPGQVIHLPKDGSVYTSEDTLPMSGVLGDHRLCTLTSDGVLTISKDAKDQLEIRVTESRGNVITHEYQYRVRIFPNYSDIKNSYATQAINTLTRVRSVSGYGDGTFRPKQIMTKEEFQAMLQRISNNTGAGIAYSPPDGGNPYPDYLDNHDSKKWYYWYVNRAENLYHVDLSNSNFGVGQPITRDAAIAYIMDAFPIDTTTASTIHPFKDLSSCNPYTINQVKEAQSCGIVKGYGDGSFHPKEPLTREMAAQMLYKVIDTRINLTNPAWSQYSVPFGWYYHSYTGKGN